MNVVEKLEELGFDSSLFYKLPVDVQDKVVCALNRVYDSFNLERERVAAEIEAGVTDRNAFDEISNAYGEMFLERFVEIIDREFSRLRIDMLPDLNTADLMRPLKQWPRFRDPLDVRTAKTIKQMLNRFNILLNRARYEFEISPDLIRAEIPTGAFLRYEKEISSAAYRNKNKPQNLETEIKRINKMFKVDGYTGRSLPLGDLKF